MIGVMSDFFEVVVFSADAQTFLTVGTASRFRVASSEDYIFPLIHSGIGEHQCRVIFNHHGGGGHHSVSLLSKKVLEGFSDFVCCHFYNVL